MLAGKRVNRFLRHCTDLRCLASERNSFYAKQPLAGSGGDGASVRSGLLGHGRADSVTGSIGGITSPLASPREAPLSEKGKGKDGGEGDKERGEE